jgi:hypothetical protein
MRDESNSRDDSSRRCASNIKDAVTTRTQAKAGTLAQEERYQHKDPAAVRRPATNQGHSNSKEVTKNAENKT